MNKPDNIDSREFNSTYSTFFSPPSIFEIFKIFLTFFASKTFSGVLKKLLLCDYCECFIFTYLSYFCNFSYFWVTMIILDIHSDLASCGQNSDLYQVSPNHCIRYMYLTSQVAFCKLRSLFLFPLGTTTCEVRVPISQSYPVRHYVLSIALIKCSS